MTATLCVLCAALSISSGADGRRDFTLWAWACHAPLVVIADVVEDPAVAHVEHENTAYRVVISRIEVIRGKLPAEPAMEPRDIAQSSTDAAHTSEDSRKLSLLVWRAGTGDADRPEWLRHGARVILFLARDNYREQPCGWQTVDLWFGALPHTATLEQRLKWSVRPAVDPIEAVIRRRPDMPIHPALPTLPPDVRGGAANEVHASVAIRAALGKLDVSGTNADWSGGVDELEKEQAVWCLQVCLIHSSDDVQIRALRALERIDDPRAVPFLLTYAEYMAVIVSGSENATMHGIIHESLAKTLSALTGVDVKLSGQDPEGLKRAVRQWRQWSLDNAK